LWYPKEKIMDDAISRRELFKAAGAGIASSGTLAAMADRLSADTSLTELLPKTKVRIAKVYLGRTTPGWPLPQLDLGEEIKRFEANLTKLSTEFEDIEFVDGGLISNDQQLAEARAKLGDVTGILAIHLSLGTGAYITNLLESNLPVMLFTMPYSGHEWHIIASLQREGKRIEVLPSSRYEDIAVAVRPFRAMQRLKEAKILHISDVEANPTYTQAIRDRFGTEIKSLYLQDLQKAYDGASPDEARADTERWIREARKIVEPSGEEILKSSRMYVALRNLLAENQAVAVTMNCLGMDLIEKGMGYPCLGFVRLNNAGLGGVCEADLKSTMTHLIFSGLVGRPGFVTDPAFDLSNDTIIHAHCVAATQMEGGKSPAAPYLIRSHLEDYKGASLQVKLPVGEKVTMARLIGTDMMLVSTGDAVDSPFVERGCRTKLTTRVQNIDRFLENWSCGLHRVVFYGDHTRDVRRFCRLAEVRMLREGIDDLRDVPGLEWEPSVHA
jgi:L-fucose isomerase-like protein